MGTYLAAELETCLDISMQHAIHMQLVMEHSVTIVSARWATVYWAWRKELNYCAWANLYFKKKAREKKKKTHTGSE